MSMCMRELKHTHLHTILPLSHPLSSAFFHFISFSFTSIFIYFYWWYSKLIQRLTFLFELLNAVVVISAAFLSVLLLSSVSPTVFTVIVEFPSTKPRLETADFSWFENLDVKRNLNREFDFFFVTTCCNGIFSQK